MEQEKGREQSLYEALEKLQKTADVLRDLGFDVIDRFINIDTLSRPTAEAGFPIVNDGMQGIRASYSQRRGFKIWFTNGFENPDSPRRQEVEKRLQDEGLL